MARDNWQDEDLDMRPTIAANASSLTGQQVAFLARTTNNDDLTPAEQEEHRMIWYEVTGHPYFPDGIPGRS